MIAGIFRTETPQHRTAITVEVHRLITVGIVTAAAGTNCLAATVIIRHQVISTIHWIMAGTDPGDRRGFGARRAGGIGTTAAGTQGSTHGAVAPIVTALWIADFRDGILGEGAGNW